MRQCVVHRIAADAVLLVHFAFVLFAVLGALLMLVSRTWIWIHLPVILWSSLVNLASWTCPLTPLEKACRDRAGQSYDGDFIYHYIAPLVYPKGMPRQLELVAGLSIVAWNALAYGALFAWQR